MDGSEGTTSPPGRADAALSAGTPLGANGLQRGLWLMIKGDPWHAHEVWEDCWRADRSPHRHAWKGLIQLAAADFHRRRGSPAIARRLVEQAAGHLLAAHHLGFDTEAVLALLDGRFAEVLERYPC